MIQDNALSATSGRTKYLSAPNIVESVLVPFELFQFLCLPEDLQVRRFISAEVANTS